MTTMGTIMAARIGPDSELLGAGAGSAVAVEEGVCVMVAIVVGPAGAVVAGALGATLVEANLGSTGMQVGMPPLAPVTKPSAEDAGTAPPPVGFWSKMRVGVPEGTSGVGFCPAGGCAAIVSDDECGFQPIYLDAVWY